MEALNDFARLAKPAATDQKDQKDEEEEEFSKEKGGKDRKNDGEPKHGADEEYELGVQFAPVIPLPDLVDVTGEEEKQVVFTARAKLFRFVKETKENKERGVGDHKILNPKTSCHRVVMCREQVHKVCTNFAVLPILELSEKKEKPNDYLESPEDADEVFRAKFKAAEIAKEIHDKFIAAAAAHPKASN
ncbi:RanBP1 domain protein [Oesophagostomum dentatum]|uniref:RanBP1 domain protein n=1 Tax=Oesophagostomum dentatum TaxID=61180 RepID=A0A0B1SN79_OESDE|nr:RanBP1 domain protein [Oesophagostomum dentatum]